MRRPVLLAAGALLILAVGVIFLALPHGRQPARITLGPTTGVGTLRVQGGQSPQAQPAETQDPPLEPQWEPVQITGDPERSPPNRADWSDEPHNWELLPVADISAIPRNVRAALEPLDCFIPGYQGRIEQSVVWGEFDRRGQRDLAVLCVHTDKTSATYLFWAADPERREVMPHSGSSINGATPAEMTIRLDPERPRAPDMPATLDHDGLEIGCCECCSTIYYRHNGQWFTLPGAD